MNSLKALHLARIFHTDRDEEASKTGLVPAKGSVDLAVYSFFR